MMSKLKPKQRTQIYLNRDQYEVLHRLSGTQQLSASELIRRAIERFLQGLERKAAPRDHLLLRIAGIVKSKLRNGSLHHDKYLYGKAR